MNARLIKLALALCSLSLLTVANPARAQETNTSETSQPVLSGRRGGYPPNMESAPVFDIQIENGELSLAAFKENPEKNPWGKTAASVSATVDNFGKYLRAVDTNLNIILSPDVGNIIIRNLKLNTRLPRSILQAVSVASGGEIESPMGGGGNGGGFGPLADHTLTFIANRPRENKPSVEVFNLSGYIQTLGKVDEKTLNEKLDELINIIANTIADMKIGTSTADVPNFKYHPGTKLFIVTGKPEQIEVARKIVNALSGQQKYGKEDLLLDVTQPSGQK